jgi:hypothetical protein
MKTLENMFLAIAILSLSGVFGHGTWQPLVAGGCAAGWYAYRSDRIDKKRKRKKLLKNRR